MSNSPQPDRQETEEVPVKASTDPVDSTTPIKTDQETWDWLPFLSNWHEKEYERRYTLEGVVITPIGLLTGLYGIIYLLLTQYDFKHSGYLYWTLFILPIIISLALSFWSAYYVYKSYAVLKNGRYKNIPAATKLRSHMDELVTYYRQYEPQTDGATKFKEYILELLADQITVNVENNDDRTISIQKAKKPLMGALLALFLSLPCFVINRLNSPDPTYNIALTSALSTSMNKPATPPPPPPPPQREIRENPTQPTPPPRPQIERK